MRARPETEAAEPWFGHSAANLCAETAALVCRLRVAFGQNLRRARIEANLTQEDVAARSGLPLQCVRGIEAGQGDPRMQAMTALALAVDRELWTLLTLPGDAALRPGPAKM